MNIFLQYTWLSKEIFEATEVLSSWRLWTVDSWFSYEGVESRATAYPNYFDPWGIFKPTNDTNGGKVWCEASNSRVELDNILL